MGPQAEYLRLGVRVQCYARSMKESLNAAFESPYIEIQTNKKGR